MSTTLEVPRAAAHSHPVTRFLDAFPANAWVFDGIAVSVFYPTTAPRDVALMGAAVVAEGHEHAAMMLLGSAPRMMTSLQRIGVLLAQAGDAPDAADLIDQVRAEARSALVASGLPLASGQPASPPAPPPSPHARCMRGVLTTSMAELRAIASWAGGLGTDDGAAYAQRATVLADAAKVALAMEAR